MHPRVGHFYGELTALPRGCGRDRPAALYGTPGDCHDGLPLAIELAVPALPVTRIEERLGRRLAPARRGEPIEPARTADLRGTPDRSYNLRDREEQTLFPAVRRLRGRLDLEVAERLVGNSLVVAEPAAAGLRSGCLEAVRPYAEERLSE